MHAHPVFLARRFCERQAACNSTRSALQPCPIVSLLNGTQQLPDGRSTPKILPILSLNLPISVLRFSISTCTLGYGILESLKCEDSYKPLFSICPPSLLPSSNLASPITMWPEAGPTTSHVIPPPMPARAAPPASYARLISTVVELMVLTEWEAARTQQGRIQLALCPYLRVRRLHCVFAVTSKSSHIINR